MNTLLEDIILSKTHSREILKVEPIQELWSGYGSISRIYLDNKTVVLKLIQYPELSLSKHPKGWNTNISHGRKVKSYQVEINWYKKYVQESHQLQMPKYIDSGLINNENYLLIEDLSLKSLSPLSQISSEQVKQCLGWLANFHKLYLGTSPKDLWDVGTYWNLETRPEEFELIKDKELKSKAHLIDYKLNNAKFKTIVHGDAKLANFLFSDTSVAAVDFQYVGGGVGIKDVAYFLSSVLDEEELKKNEQICLNYYFSQLNNLDIEKEWRELYPYAWCDFYRFLEGWSPGHSKINTYSHKMKQKVLSCL